MKAPRTGRNRRGMSNVLEVRRYAYSITPRTLLQQSANAKLNPDKVREIRRLYAQGGISQQRLGDMFGIDQTIVSDIVRRRSWKHVT